MINEFNTLNTQTQASYNKSFGEHNVDALLGFETEDYHYSQTYLSGESYPGDKYEFENANSTSTQTDKQGYRLTSFLGRVNYNYADKYCFGVSYRRDSSSLNGSKTDGATSGLCLVLGDSHRERNSWILSRCIN